MHATIFYYDPGESGTQVLSTLPEEKFSTRL